MYCSLYYADRYIENPGSKSFKRNGVYVTDPVLSDGTANFTPSGEVRGGVKTTFHAGLKNDDVQSSASQVIGAAKVFDAFGNELSSTGAWKSQFGYAGKFGYQGDADSGLKLLGHRYYDSSTGRFLTRDPIKDGPNWYSYCYNNPVSFMDAAGLMGFAVLVANPIGIAALAVCALIFLILWYQSQKGSIQPVSWAPPSERTQFPQTMDPVSTDISSDGGPASDPSGDDDGRPRMGPPPPLDDDNSLIPVYRVGWPGGIFGRMRIQD